MTIKNLSYNVLRALFTSYIEPHVLICGAKREVPSKEELGRLLYLTLPKINIKNDFVIRKISTTLSNEDLILLSNSGDNKKSKQDLLYDFLCTHLEEQWGLTTLKTQDIVTDFTINPLPPYKVLFDYQNKVKTEIIAILESQNRLLVQMPTGSGKTRTAIESLIEYIKLHHNGCGTVLWLAHSRELVEQALTSFAEIYPYKGGVPARASLMKSTKVLSSIELDFRFICSTFKQFTESLKKEDSNYKWLKENVSILMVDEAHQTLAPTYKKAILNCIKYSRAKIIGLSATPGRSAFSIEENYNLVNFYNKNIIKLPFENPILELQKKGFLSILNYKKTPSFCKDSIYKISKGKDLALNHEFNKLIIDTIQRALKEDKKILVFTSSVNQSVSLSIACNALGIPSDSVDSTLNEFIRRKTIESFKDGKSKVLFNYSILSTGFDDPKIDVIIIARPTSSPILFSQIIGRGLRGEKMGGTKTCDIYDFHNVANEFGDENELFNFFESYWKKS